MQKIAQGLAQKRDTGKTLPISACNRQKEDPMPLKTVSQLSASLSRNPQRAVGFAVGIFLPLALAGIIWAQNTGGLAGPLVDTRPPAFTIPTE
jgi:hypothetical protein